MTKEQTIKYPKSSRLGINIIKTLYYTGLILELTINKIISYAKRTNKKIQ